MMDERESSGQINKDAKPATNNDTPLEETANENEML